MHFKKSGHTYIVLIERGERIIEQLTKFCKDRKITAGYFTGIGAVDEAELMHYIVDNRKYSSKTFSEPLEITNMTGNIATLGGEPYIHSHITLGRQDMRTVGGHLKEAKVHAVCEVYLVSVDEKLVREKDEGLGLNVWKF